VSTRAGWLTAFGLLLATLTGACDDGVTNAFVRRGQTGTSSNNAAVTGRVTTATGGVGGVNVVLVGRDSVQTDGNGAYAFRSIPAGTYTVSVRVPVGFALAAGTSANQSVTVGVGGTGTADFTLQQTTTTP
jgi:hypothetical protein